MTSVGFVVHVHMSRNSNYIYLDVDGKFYSKNLIVNEYEYAEANAPDKTIQGEAVRCKIADLFLENKSESQRKSIYQTLQRYINLRDGWIKYQIVFQQKRVPVIRLYDAFIRRPVIDLLGI